MKNKLSYFYRMTVIPNLYFLSMWLVLVTGVSLMFGDFYRGAGIVSCLCLFYILNNYYKVEMYRIYKKNSMEFLGVRDNDESPEA